MKRLRDNWRRYDGWGCLFESLRTLLIIMLLNAGFYLLIITILKVKGLI